MTLVGFSFRPTSQALVASQGAREEGSGEGISASRELQAYWSCRLGEAALDIFVAKFSQSLGPGCVDIVVLGERTLFTIREQGTVRLQKMLGDQAICACKYAVAATPGEDGARLTGTTVQESDEAFAIVEDENLIVANDTNQLAVYKVCPALSTSGIHMYVQIHNVAFAMFEGGLCHRQRPSTALFAAAYINRVARRAEQTCDNRLQLTESSRVMWSARRRTL